MVRKLSDYHAFCYSIMGCFGWFSAFSWTYDKLLGEKTSLVKQRTYWKSGKKRRVHPLWKEGKITSGDYSYAGRLCRKKLRSTKPPWSLITAIGHWPTSVGGHSSGHFLGPCWGPSMEYHCSVSLKKKKVDRRALSQPAQFWGSNLQIGNYQETRLPEEGCRSNIQGRSAWACPQGQPWLMWVDHERRALRTNLPAKTWGGEGFYQCQWGCAGSPIQITIGKGALQVLWSETCQPVNLKAKLRGRLEESLTTVKVWSNYWVCFYAIVTGDDKK